MTSLPLDSVGRVLPAADGTKPAAAPRVPHKVDELSPFEQFEAFALRSFVESMLPSEASHVFGSGTAGNIWRSMMAEQLGNEIARHGGIGIADTIAEDRGSANRTASEIAGGSSARLRFDAVLAQTTKP